MSDLSESLAAVGEAVGEPPPSLRAAIAERARDIRPVTVVPPCTPIEAYRGAADDLRALLGSVEDVAGVGDIVGHVAGVEELVLRWLAGEVIEVDDHQAVRSPIGADAWFSRTDDVVRAAADLTRPVQAYGLETDVEGLLVLRTFELWTHAQDACRLAGIPMPDTDPARLALMSSRLSAVLPAAMAVRDTRMPGRTARLVLTGVAPGCFDVPLDPDDEAGEPDVTIVVDVVEVCRLAARRATVEEIGAVLDGDDELGRLVLAAADAFAQD